ncbi:MAG: class I SAM-dependent methyltransferase [Candidatus Thorarchaeota archaeon]|jgi:ubiquinone/menaquinone biosynthesis C-methylase UbiE
MAKYDPKIIEGHFDKFGIAEWERLEATPYGEVQFHIHNHYLKEYIQKGDRVFEIGSGAGRFTVELARMGALVAVADISNEQLRLNEEKLKEMELEAQVEWRKKMDLVNLEEIADDTFDATVCYGGPLSYVLEYVHQALGELVRVTKPGGFILTSVMSCLGTYHHLINNVFEAEKELGLDVLDRLTQTGDVVGKLAGEGTNHCHMYRWSEYRDILSKHPVDIVDVSAANFLSTGTANTDLLNEIRMDAKKWDTFLKWELDFTKEAGAMDTSTHMIAILRKRT